MAHASNRFAGVDDDLSLVHRRIVRVSAAAAWLVATVYLVGGVLSNNSDLFQEAVAPGLAAALMTGLILFRRENGVVALIGWGLALLVSYSLIGSSTTMVPVAIALVVISAIGTLLVPSHHLAATIGLGILLAASPLLWSMPTGEALKLGMIMSLAFFLMATVLLTVRESAVNLSYRYGTLFENSPGAVMEEDWSEAIEYVRSEYSGRPDRILAFLRAYPQVVRRAIARSKVVRANQAALDLLEVSVAEELLGYRDGNAVREETLEAFAVALASIYRGDTSFEHDWPARTLRDRSVWLQVKGTVISAPSDGSPRILVGLADITHMKARQEAMAELVRAKDDFLARVSHELRTPLTAVLGLASELNSSEEMTPEERTELMGLVAAQAMEMSFLVEDLLVASRAEMGTIAVSTAVVDLESELLSAVESTGIGLTGMPENLPEAVADPGRVRQILRNLLTNAQRYGGPRVRVTAGSGNDMVWLEVRDDGDGVPASLAATIFEAYGATHRRVEGSVGLGLSVSRHLAELMGGTLEYRRDGMESVFRLELPSASGSIERSLASQAVRA
jgi:signal transduction histidine kinase